MAAITGAATGIGHSIALRFAQEGADIGLLDVDEAGLAKVQREVEAMGRRAVGYPADVRQRHQIQQAVQGIVQTLGRLDIWVNNAGVNRNRPWLEFSEEEWDNIQAVNLKGVFLCCQVVAPILQRQQSGRIINLASIAGKQGIPDITPYAASKAGVISLTRSLARALAPYGVTVNALCPGIIDTAMWERVDEEVAAYTGRKKGEFKQEVIPTIPLERMGTPEDVAGVAAFLASADASYITGQAINVDGGLVMEA